MIAGRDRLFAFSGGVEQLDDRRRQASKIADFGNEVVAMYRSSFAERYVQADVYLAVRMAGIGSRKHGFLITGAKSWLSQLRNWACLPRVSIC